MVIALTPEIEVALQERARKKGVTPEELALSVLRERLLPKTADLEPRDEWERKLLAAATDCGVALSDEALSREELYD